MPGKRRSFILASFIALIPGSKAFECVQCKTKVFLSPVSQKLAVKGVEIICIPCAIRFLAPSDQIPITSEQLAEFEAEMIRRGVMKKEGA